MFPQPAEPLAESVAGFGRRCGRLRDRTRPVHIWLRGWRQLSVELTDGLHQLPRDERPFRLLAGFQSPTRRRL